MDTFHSGIENISVQQEPSGRLPKKLLAEIDFARKLAKDFIAELGPTKAREIDQKVLRDNSYWPEDVVKLAAARKIYSLWLPKIFGGGGLHPLSMFSFNSELASYCLGIANLVGAHYVGLSLVSASSHFKILQKIIDEIRQSEKNGDHCVVSTAITEASAGSDLEDTELIQKAKVCTQAKKVDGGYSVTGQKIFISNSIFAKWHIVSAYEDLHKPHLSTLICAIPANSKGVSLGRSEKKLGQSGSPANVLFFDQVFVPDENICFSRSQFTDDKTYLRAIECLLNDTLSLPRAGVAVMSSGVIKNTIELVQNHCEHSTWKGKKLSDFEWAQGRVGTMLQNYVQVKALAWEGHLQCYARGPYKDLHKPIVYWLLKNTPSFLLKIFLGKWLQTPRAKQKMRQQRLESYSLENEKIVSGYGSLLKSSASDLAMETLFSALDIVGSTGSLEHLELEKKLRDTKLLQIYEGTNELNRLMIYKNFAGSATHENNIFQGDL